MDMAQRLDERCVQVERVLAQRGAPCRATGARVLPGFVEIALQPGAQTKVQQVRALQQDVAVALGNNNTRVVLGDRGLVVQIPRSNPERVDLAPLLVQAQSSGAPPFTAVLGLAEDGATLMACLAAPEVSHMLIAGTTGSGKTSLAQSIMLSLAGRHRPAELGFVIIDPTSAFEAQGRIVARHQLMPTASEAPDALASLRRVVHAMDQRGAQVSNPRIVVYVDEVADLIMTGGDEVVQLLSRIAQRGRQSGIHLVVATQKPMSTVVGPLFKANLPFRLVGRVLSPEDAKVATGIAGTGAEKLNGRGDFLCVAAGRVVRFQAALPDLSQYLQRAPQVDPGWSVSRAPEPKPEPAPALPEPEAAPYSPEHPWDVLADGPKATITEENVTLVIGVLRARSYPVTRANVCRMLGQVQAGGALRMLREVTDRMGVEWD